MKEISGCIFILYALVKIGSENVIAGIIVAIFMGVVLLVWMHTHKKKHNGSYVKVNQRKQHQSNSESNLAVDYPEKSYHSNFNSSSGSDSD